MSAPRLRRPRKGNAAGRYRVNRKVSLQERHAVAAALDAIARELDQAFTRERSLTVDRLVVAIEAARS